MSNAFGSALNPAPQSFDIWGEVVKFEATHVVLQKGVRGGVPFDEDVHSLDQRLTRIDIAVQPLSQSKLDRLTERDGMIAEFAKDPWQKVTLPSLAAIGIDTPEKLQAMEGKFVKVELEKYDTYKKKDGTQGDLTAFKFTQIFDSEQACVDDYFAAFGNVSTTVDNGNGGAGAMASAMASTTNGNSPAQPKVDNDQQRKTAEAFLPGLVGAAGGDTAKLSELLKQTPLVKDYFTIDSPEVQALLPQPA